MKPTQKGYSKQQYKTPVGSPLGRATDPLPNHTHSAALSTHLGDWKQETMNFLDTKYPYSLFPHIKHPLTEGTTFLMISPLWTSHMIPGTPPHVNTNLQIA